MRPIKSFLLVCIYALAYYLLQYILYKTGVVEQFPNAKNLLNWDAKWYHSIAEHGYQYSLQSYSNSGFFILFPVIWKICALNPHMVVLVNIILFAAGFTMFHNLYKVDNATKLLWLTFPSFYIIFVPYSEALFFFLSTVLIWGMVKKNKYAIWVALFLLSLTRPVVIVLMPAFFIAELMMNSNKDWLASIKKFFVYYGFPLLLGLVLFIVYQYYETGVWLAYFRQQRLHWGHVFNWPVLPFNSAFGLRLLWLNGIALFLGFIGLLLLISYGIKWLFHNKMQQDKVFVVSCLYFMGMGLVTIFFNSTWDIDSTNVFDVHRYTFVTPFFWVLLYRFTIVNTYKPIDYLKVFVLLNIFWLSFYSFQHIQRFMYFNMASCFVLLYMWQGSKLANTVRFPILIIIGITFQVLMLQWYLSWVYPG